MAPLAALAVCLGLVVLGFLLTRGRRPGGDRGSDASSAGPDGDAGGDGAACSGDGGGDGD